MVNWRGLGNVRGGRSLVLGAIAIIPIAISPIPIVAQPSSLRVSQTNLSPSKQQALAEAEWLTQKIFQLYGQRQYAEAVPLAERILIMREEALGKEHLDVAKSLVNLAELHRILGNYSQALPLLQRAVGILEMRGAHPQFALGLNNLAGVYLNQGNHAQALSLFQRALAIFETALGREHYTVARTLNNLAEVYRAQSNYSQALPLYQRALAIHKKVGEEKHPWVAETLNNLALLYQAQGKYDKALPLHQRALAIAEEILGEEHPLVAASLNNLALLYWEQGNYIQALPLFQRALVIVEKILGKDHPNVATTLSNLGLVYDALGNDTQALSLHQHALTIRELSLGEGHPDVGTSLSNVAGLHQDQGDFAQALPLFQRALAIHKKALGPEHPTVAIDLNNLAGLYDTQGNFAQALPLFQSALAIFEKALGEEHPNVAVSISNLAGIYRAQENPTLATELMIRANNIHEKNLNLILSTGSEASKRSYMETLTGTTAATVSLHLQDAPNSLQSSHLALTTVLRRKGRVLDVLTNNLQALRQNLTPENQNLLDQLNRTRSKLATLIFKGVGNVPIEQYQSVVSTLQTEAEKLEDTLSQRSAEFRNQFQPATIEAVQRRIPQDTVLVELVLYYPFNPKASLPNQRWSPPRYATYVLHSQGEPQWVDLGEARAIDQAIEDFRDNLRDAETPIDKQLKPSARQLDTLVMEPVRKLLGNTRKILVSPDGQLNLVPFAALVDENNEYLLKNYTITTLSSGRDLLRHSSASTTNQSPVLLANPHFNQSGKSRTVPAQTNRPSNQRPVDADQLKVGPLPGTATEVQEIAKLLSDAELLTESAATENALKQLQSPKILHLATHGFFLNIERVVPLDFAGRSLLQDGNVPRFTPVPQENPLLRSGLALAGFNIRKSGAEDGVLTALEVAGLDLRGTQLVVLSACETGVGDVANGEGVYGLRRAFVIAGAESQLFSLWKVDDDAAKDLMVAYYEKLTAGKGRSEAIRETQLEMLQGDKYQHPYYWASFVPSGNWAAIDEQSLSLNAHGKGGL